MSVDRPQIIRHKLHGMANLAHTLLNPDHPFFYLDKKYRLKFMPQAARAALGNMPDCAKKTLSLKTASSSAVQILQVIAAGWREAGLKVKTSSYEWGRFYQDLKAGNFQVALLQWTGVIDPDIYRIAFHSSEQPPQGRNRGFYSHQIVDKLLIQGLSELNLRKRKQIYKKIQKIMAKDIAFIPLWHKNQIAVVKSNIKHYHQTRRGDFGYLNTVKKVR